MRFHLLGLAALAVVATPAFAQDRPYVQPEIRNVQQPVPMGGVPANSAVANLTARLDSMERQLARLTGENEESAHRIRQLEQALNDYKREAEARAQAALATPEPLPEETATLTMAEPDNAAQPATGDAGEDAYITGFRQWEAKQYGAAQKSLEAMAKKFPKHARTSHALNLAGRAYLDEGKPATAAKILLSNYQTNPKGDRAADSLYFLGQALVELKKPSEACKVYEELAEVYPGMRDWLKQRLPDAREQANCA